MRKLLISLLSVLLFSSFANADYQQFVKNHPRARYFYRMADTSGTTVVESIGTNGPSGNGTYQGSGFSLNQASNSPNRDPSASATLGSSSFVQFPLITDAPSWYPLASVHGRWATAYWVKFGAAPTGGCMAISNMPGHSDYAFDNQLAVGSGRFHEWQSGGSTNMWTGGIAIDTTLNVWHLSVIYAQGSSGGTQWDHIEWFWDGSLVATNSTVVGGGANGGNGFVDLNRREDTNAEHCSSISYKDVAVFADGRGVFTDDRRLTAGEAEALWKLGTGRYRRRR